MPKHHVFLHIGPDDVDLSEDDVTRLAAAGVRATQMSKDDVFRATLEIRRSHQGAGLKRKDVEGAWAEICRKTYALRSDAFLSLPGFWDADETQAALALDGLHGLKVHLVATGRLELPSAWSAPLKPERVHVLQSSTPSELTAQVSRIALTMEKARLDKSLLKLKKRRKRVKKKLSG